MTQRMPTPVCLLLLMIVVLLQPVPGVAAQNNRSAEMLRAIPVPNLASDLWRAVRQRDGLILPARSQQQGPESTIIINPYGEQFRQLRVNKIIPRLLYVLPVVMVLILLFFLIRGRLRLQDGFSGDKIPRFKTYERLLHWLMAISFLVLACTGIVLIFGRKILLPLIGKDAFNTIAQVSKFLHGYIGPAFVLFMVLVLLLWFRRNIYRHGDFNWLLKGGGFFGKVHVQAGFFNMGEKTWYWILFFVGLTVSVTGLLLDFPNLVTLGREPISLALMIHGVAATILFAISLGHIYLATVGVAGTFDSMKTGYVDRAWAREHHGGWVDELDSKEE